MRSGNLQLLIVALCFIGACTGKNNIEVRQLSAQTVRFDGDNTLVFRSPSRLVVRDSLLFLLTRNENLIQVFSYPDIHFISSFGLYGRGPDEMLGVVDFYSNGDTVYVLPVNTKSIYKYTISGIVSGDDKPVSKRKYENLIEPLINCRIRPPQIISLNSVYPRLSIMSLDEDPVKCSEYGLPEIGNKVEEKIPALYVPTLWQSVVDYEPQLHLAVSATMLGDVLEIFNTDDLSRKVIVGKGGAPNIFKEGKSVSIGRVDGYGCVSITGCEIYALYSGADRKEQSAMRRAGIESPSGGDIIRVFSLEGSLLKEYHLDRHISSFYVDTEMNQIFAIDPNSQFIFCRYVL